MQYCTCTVRLRGSRNHEVANKLVTVPEIRLLQQLHGRDAVLDIRPVDAPKDAVYDHDTERQRLVNMYERNPETKGLVARQFGPFGALPLALKDIGVNPRAIAEVKRREAAEALAAAEALEAQEADEAADLNEFEAEAQARLDGPNDEDDEDDDFEDANAGEGAAALM